VKELYRKHRPKKFEDVIGQDDAVETLTRKFETNSIPHAILFHGPYGTGKTTLARIVVRHLKCGKFDFVEKNTADYRGIDDIRSIRNTINQAPIDGDSRVWLLDECFVGDTIIETPNGSKYLRDIKVGDSVYSAFGLDKVINVFKKQIPLNRLVKIRLSDGRTIYCSDGHEFYTERGWVRTKNLLKKDLLFSFVPYMMQEILKGTKYENNNMSKLQERNIMFNGIGKCTNILQQVLCYSVSVSKNGETMSGMRQTCTPICESTGQIQQNFLQSELSTNRQNEKTRISEKDIQQKNKQKNKSVSLAVLPKRARLETSRAMFLENDRTQSFPQSKNRTESNEDKTTEGYLTCLEGQTWWQRTIHQITTKIMDKIRLQLEVGIINTNKQEGYLSNQLQSRYRKQVVKNSYRSRWKRTSCEEIYAKRCQETETIGIVGVESIEIYQHTNNKSSFEGVVDDKEKITDEITLYDLEMENHPSYFANGILVHNCHKCTGDAQNAMLKLLEDPPEHVYFMLATTEPEKLLAGIRQRCLQVKLNPISEDALEDILNVVCGKEGIKISHTVIEKIAEYAGGAAREALQILDKVYQLDGEKNQLKAIEKSSTTTATIEIARKLMNPKTKWREIAPILKELENEDAENIRWMILGYGKSVLLKSDNARAFRMIEAFRDNFYDSKWAGVVSACYEILQEK